MKNGWSSSSTPILYVRKNVLEWFYWTNDFIYIIPDRQFCVFSDFPFWIFFVTILDTKQRICRKKGWENSSSSNWDNQATAKQGWLDAAQLSLWKVSFSHSETEREYFFVAWFWDLSSERTPKKNMIKNRKGQFVSW